MRHFKFLILFATTLLFSNPMMPRYMNREPDKIYINNTILAKVGDETISVYDVKKQLDLNFSKSFPDLQDSISAKFQFYSTGWEQILEELINTKLILLDAQKKELKISDAEIREELENRYGPNILTNLQMKELTYDEAFKNIKEEFIMQRMLWYFVRSKAFQKATPEAIKHSYRMHAKKNPAYKFFSYHTISFKTEDKGKTEILNKFISEIKEKTLGIEEAKNLLEKEYKNSNIVISPIYQQKSIDLSKSYQEVLTNLGKNEFSLPLESNRNNSYTYKVFYLVNIENKEAENFSSVSNKLKDEIMQKAIVDESENYFNRLKKENPVERVILPSNFKPFEIL
ncbi:MAG: hypothetical protein A3F40_05090 [Chlamydiae bacterium RIFCSPHIGHO2_12_FULL_27_8]|nr:MAG: hypothetical protein A3F40_05090 [Chlamydiae bacterium RIFCSPHIGHO2_12_FULL_27_8]OGN64907.1 MAG: hypothetical protein A2888_03080 [Chlamydiae bacterium RIFCSPLOWO2_01_FULL_28_7]